MDRERDRVRGWGRRRSILKETLEQNTMRHPLVIAHRGASWHYPENTMLAFQKAIEAKADMIEMDVRLTKDHRVVVFHDSDLRRLFQKRGKIAALTYESLRARTDGVIPLLKDVLKTFLRKTKFYIEIKADGLSRKNRELLVRKVHQSIGPGNARGDCLVASFDRRVLRQYRRLAPGAQTGFIFVRRQPMRHAKSSWLADADVVCPHKRLLTARLVAAAKTLGKKIYPWVLDDWPAQQRAISLGVDGIVTNDPAALVERLMKMGTP